MCAFLISGRNSSMLANLVGHLPILQRFAVLLAISSIFYSIVTGMMYILGYVNWKEFVSVTLLDYNNLIQVRMNFYFGNVEKYLDAFERG